SGAISSGPCPGRNVDPSRGSGGSLRAFPNDRTGQVVVKESLYRRDCPAPLSWPSRRTRLRNSTGSQPPKSTRTAPEQRRGHGSITACVIRRRWGGKRLKHFLASLPGWATVRNCKRRRGAVAFLYREVLGVVLPWPEIGRTRGEGHAGFEDSP